MIKIILSDGTELMARWVGVSGIDGKLRFELIGYTLYQAFATFLDTEKLETISRVYIGDNEQPIEYNGYTTIDAVEKTNGGVIVTLSNGGET